MHIRLATTADVVEVAAVHTAAFSTDNFFGFFCPGRKEHPADYKEWAVTALHQHLRDPRRAVLVAVADAEDFVPIPGKPQVTGNPGKIVGLVVWWLWALDPASAATSVALDIPRPSSPGPKISPDNKASSKENWALFEATVHAKLQALFATEHTVNWHLHWLATHPGWHGRGAGSLLVNWGFEQAARERLAVVVETANARAFYLKTGFEDLGESTIGPVTMNVLIRRPEVGEQKE
ncbi:acyl-CoA N-acyltransferase [Sphaerosporella brunnea]|uniref:Acyl-CoA N-acyltransferase n=1 Tax=Sphaerosporella brunnea TaxID=1250544 RepID=A0A5J5ET96_9PEZI|nr:acyl-CoA N-acyltransferase [Sphaerosporella brunnea]